MMKPFDDLTDLEIVALSDSAMERYIDLASAEAGIPLPGDPPIPPSKSSEDLSADMDGFVVTATFANKHDAEQVAAAATAYQRLTTAYMSGPSYKQKFEPEEDPVRVTVIRHYSEAKAAAQGTRIAQFERIEADYKAARTTFETVTRKRAELAARMLERRSKAQAEERRRESYRSTFANYLQLAENDRRIACRFMAKAYPDAPDLIPEMFEPDEQGAQYGTRAYVDEELKTPAEAGQEELI